MITPSMAKEGREMRKQLREKSFCGIVVRWFGPGDLAMGTENVFGPADPISLMDIAQNPNVHGIVASLYGMPTGVVWKRDHVRMLRQSVESHGLQLVGIESLWPGEDVICGGPRREEYIAAFCESADNIGAEGVGVITYNLIAAAGDWLRNTYHRWPTGGVAVGYDRSTARAASSLSKAYSVSELARLESVYEKLGKHGIWDHAAYFIEQITPTFRKHEGRLQLALHPDDPPENRGKVPTAFSCEEDLAQYLSFSDESWHSLCFCTGTLGSRADNDVVGMIRRFSKRIAWAHFRSVQLTENGFVEAPHELGQTPLLQCLRELHAQGWTGDIRPDHGLAFQGDRFACDGYGYQDRVLRGASLLYGWANAITQIAAGAV